MLTEAAVSQLFAGLNGVGKSTGTANAVAAILNGNIMPQMSDDGTSDPRVLYTKISGSPDHAMEGPSGLEEGRWQLDIFASTSKAAKTLRDAIKQNADGFRGTINAVSPDTGSVSIQSCLADGDRDILDAEPGDALNREFGVSLDFFIQFQF